MTTTSAPNGLVCLGAICAAPSKTRLFRHFVDWPCAFERTRTCVRAAYVCLVYVLNYAHTRTLRIHYGAIRTRLHSRSCCGRSAIASFALSPHSGNDVCSRRSHTKYMSMYVICSLWRCAIGIAYRRGERADRLYRFLQSNRINTVRQHYVQQHVYWSAYTLLVLNAHTTPVGWYTCDTVKPVLSETKTICL